MLEFLGFVFVVLIALFLVGIFTGKVTVTYDSNEKE